MTENSTLRVATYNIHACIGRDKRFDPQRIVDVINNLDADLLALQEVEHHLVDDQDLLTFIARETGYHAYAGPTMKRGTRNYGNAVLSRLPVKNTLSRDLSVSGREPRGLIEIQLEIEGRTVLLLATHLGLRPVERRSQIEQIIALLVLQQADTVILLGDLNEWFLWGRPLRWLSRYFAKTPHVATFPVSWPLFALDRIWVNPVEQLISLTTYQGYPAREASDHLPLVAEIVFHR